MKPNYKLRILCLKAHGFDVIIRESNETWADITWGSWGYIYVSWNMEKNDLFPPSESYLISYGMDLDKFCAELKKKQAEYSKVLEQIRSIIDSPDEDLKKWLLDHLESWDI